MTRQLDFNFTIDIPVIGEWDNVDMVRLSLQTCVATLFQDVDRRHTLAMVAGELLENAVKYADRPHEVTIFRVRVWGNAVDAFVQVSNPITEESADVVFDSIRRIKSADSAAAAYCQRLLEISSLPSRMSRLGLLRIAYEGGCALDAIVQDQILTVTASLPCVA